MDTAGYRFPVYLTAWGSGMNALETYLMLPFVALFGLKTWVIRLPQLLVGCLSLPALYGVVRRVREEKQALVTMLLLAICPWHVLLSRWGLESNLAPGVLLFGLYFFLQSLENYRFYPLAGLFYGMSLYAYATLWPFVPLLLGLSLLYTAVHGKLRFSRQLLFGGLILALLASPLLLFLAVNFGWSGEIRTAFFSVPKLLYMRSGELSFAHVPENLKNLFTILWTQSDGLPWNTAGGYGLLYPLSAPFALLGLLSLRRLAKLLRLLSLRRLAKLLCLWILTC
jgi:4-amino-4-deoxy-L-arabinose transferase-like glycosyltransferase